MRVKGFYAKLTGPPPPTPSPEAIAALTAQRERDGADPRFFHGPPRGVWSALQRWTLIYSRGHAMAAANRFAIMYTSARYIAVSFVGARRAPLSVQELSCISHMLARTRINTLYASFINVPETQQLLLLQQLQRVQGVVHVARVLGPQQDAHAQYVQLWRGDGFFRHEEPGTYEDLPDFLEDVDLWMLVKAVVVLMPDRDADMGDGSVGSGSGSSSGGSGSSKQLAAGMAGGKRHLAEVSSGLGVQFKGRGGSSSSSNGDGSGGSFQVSAWQEKEIMHVLGLDSMSTGSSSRKRKRGALRQLLSQGLGQLREDRGAAPRWGDGPRDSVAAQVTALRQLYGFSSTLDGAVCRRGL